ncbi:MAG TPA: acyltransferase [Bryobacteraceae bacterium]|nr:acyltransferase [Bryobacteraceae bacterium]
MPAGTSALPGIASAPTGSSGSRISELDGIRGLAILLVLLYHYVNVAIPEHSLWYYALLPSRLGWSGVDLFFVLSGFLIGGILIDHRGSDRYFSVFYIRRVHRIFPIYYLMIAFLAVGELVLPHAQLFLTGIPLWVYPLFAQNLMGDFTRGGVWLGVSWSLAVEEQFYLAFPLVVRLLSRRRLLWFLAACIVGAPLFRAALIAQGQGFAQVHALLPARADALALGVLAAIIVRSEEAKRWMIRHSRMCYASLFVCIGLLPALLKWSNYAWQGTGGYSLLALTYFQLVLLLLIKPLSPMLTFFRSAWLRWLGGVSYCVYLIHEPIRHAAFWIAGFGQPVINSPATLTIALGALAATLALAQLSWVVLEKRLITRAHVRYHY